MESKAKLYVLRVKAAPEAEIELRKVINKAVAEYIAEHPELGKGIIVEMEDITNAYVDKNDDGDK